MLIRLSSLLFSQSDGD